MLESYSWQLSMSVWSYKTTTRQILLSVLQLFVAIICIATVLQPMQQEKCYTLKGQSLENGLSCIFQAIGNTLKKDAKPA